jgi:hypothetical protein
MEDNNDAAFWDVLSGVYRLPCEIHFGGGLGDIVRRLSQSSVEFLVCQSGVSKGSQVHDFSVNFHDHTTKNMTLPYNQSGKSDDTKIGGT